MTSENSHFLRSGPQGATLVMVTAHEFADFFFFFFVCVCVCGGGGGGGGIRDDVRIS